MKYKFRAECILDVNRFIEELTKHRPTGPLKYSVEQMSINGARIPDVEVELTTDADLEDLQVLALIVPDGHVMAETVMPADQYTGERRELTNLCR